VEDDPGERLERVDHGENDAVHLATALLWKEMSGVDVVMATHDGALAVGARAHGFRVVGVPSR
jgi:hypothetical protein